MADLIEQDDMSTVPPAPGRQMPEWHVYQLRSETELLYVGYSRRVKDRIAAHRREKPWWPEVTEVLSERFASEDDARQREKQLWAEEGPKYNKVSPFRTDEEYQATYRSRTRTGDQSPESRTRRLERERERDARRRRTGEKAWRQRNINMTPEQRETKRERKRRFVARGGSRSWRQTGPGLFS